jgi:tRNA 2-selenouridine synthase
MARIFETEAFLNEAVSFPVIDVRSPGEFAHGHIPGAVNIPLFDDAERAVIGTLYNRSGSETAIRKGLEIATPKVPVYLSMLRSVTQSRKILVHCWRGGMRSEQMAALFEREGFEPGLLSGGYKAYRKHIRALLSRPAGIIVLGGYTGSGKTDLLGHIKRMGCQVIDLEELACHKGSAFGALGQLPQPTNEQFENDLYNQWSRLDQSKPIWIEDESRMIGRVTIPDPVFDKISKGILLRLEMPRALRVQRLVEEYAGFDKVMLSEAVQRISERLGRPRTREALDSIEAGEFTRVAENVLKYYDKAYQFAIDRRPGQKKFVIETEAADAQTAEKLVSFIQERIKYGTDLS